MIIKVKDLTTGTIYTSDMSDSNKNVILAINFCTSYSQVNVQTETIVSCKVHYVTHDIIVPPVGSEVNWVDLIATQKDNKGEWVN